MERNTFPEKFIKRNTLNNKQANFRKLYISFMLYLLLEQTASH